jgi:hypothetical protein
MKLTDPQNFSKFSGERGFIGIIPELVTSVAQRCLRMPASVTGATGIIRYQRNFVSPRMFSDVGGFTYDQRYQ